MGVVCRARDLSTGKRVALKQLITVASTVNFGRMFEREYHTLKSLAHPRIIEVYDYGLYRGAPYYTMELLDGKDLRDLAPLSYRSACRYLHDVASSLALLHARRFLHRDLSPRNVRVTSDDRCKLIDFGALTSFGVADAIVGTPPLVPPEALHHAPLDQRADLFSLGALAYWLLTKRHAFPVNELSELPAAWRQTPPRPSEVVKRLAVDTLEPLPQALDDLVMGLLTLDPLGRPSSAAEVMDAFVAIGAFEPDPEQLSSQSYLRSPALVGRERETPRLEKRLRSTLQGQGSSMVIEAAAGMGSSRLLTELLLRAQVGGAMPLLVDAPLHRGPYGVVHELIDKTLQAAPQEALQAMGEHAAMLARFSSAIAGRLSVTPDSTDFTNMRGELRRRTQHALTEWLLALSKLRPIVIAVDGLHHADEGSLALLATLAHRANEHALLLVVAHDPQQSGHAGAIKAIDSAGASMTLRPLTGAQVTELVRSLFGDVANAARLADWLRGLSGGSPRACLALVQHLIERNVVRYVGGMWILPLELLPEALPDSLDQVIAARLERLPVAARKLAEALSVHHGKLSLARCLAIAAAEGLSDAFEVIEELVREGVLVQTGENYLLSHDSLRETLLAGLDPRRLARLHAQLGALLLPKLENDVHAMLDAGWHLLHGGKEAQGAALLAKAGIMLCYDSDEMPAAVAPLKAALAVYRKQKRSHFELVQLLGPLTMAGLYTDRRLADQFGDETIASLKRVLGLSLAERLRPWLGARLGLYAGLGYGALGFLLLPGRGGVDGFRKTLTLFIQCVMCLVGVATVCFQHARCAQVARELEILTALGPDHAATLSHRLARLFLMGIEDRQAESIAGFEQVLARLDDPRPIADLPADSRRLIHGTAIYALGMLDNLRAGHIALQCAERLDTLGIRIYAMLADQIRASHYALRGQSVLANQYREQVELHAVQLGSGWQAEILGPASRAFSQALCHDRIGIKQSMEVLERLAVEVPWLERHARSARATYYAMTGNPAASYEIRKALFEGRTPRDLVGWSATISQQGENLRLMRRFAEAKELLESNIALLSAADRTIVVMTHRLFMELALVYAELGDLDTAGRILDQQLAEHKDCDAALVLGNFHGARTRVALLAGDHALAARHLLEMERWYRPTENPTLIALCEQLRREVFRNEDIRSTSPPRVLASDAEQDSVRSVLSQCQGAKARADCALQLLLECTGGVQGYLFVAGDQGPELISPREGLGPPTEVQAQVQAALTRSTNDATVVEQTAQMTTRIVERGFTHTVLNAPVYRVVLLCADAGAGEGVVGAAAIALGDSHLRAPDPRVLQAIAQALVA